MKTAVIKGKGKGERHGQRFSTCDRCGGVHSHLTLGSLGGPIEPLVIGDLPPGLFPAAVAAQAGQIPYNISFEGGSRIAETITAETQVPAENHHTEHSFLIHLMPDLLWIYGLEGGGVHTHISSVHEAIDLVPARAREILQEGRFRLSAPPRWVEKSPTHIPEVVAPVIRLIRGRWWASVALYKPESGLPPLTQAIDREAHRALLAFEDALTQVEISVQVAAHTLLIVPNGFSTHARGPGSTRKRVIQRFFSMGSRAKIHTLSRVLGQLGGHLILCGEDG